MKTYNYGELAQCHVCGSVNGNIEKFFKSLLCGLSDTSMVEKTKDEKEREERLAQRNPRRRGLRTSMLFGNYSTNGIYNNSLVIVLGNCGIGTKSLSYYTSLFEKMNTALAANNCHIAFVRGCSDDPSIFNGDTTIEYSNIRMVCDYAILQLKNYNVLSIGGGVSLDREWKKIQQERLGCKLYWEDEAPTFNADDVDEIIKAYNIAVIATYCAPTFAWPGTNAINRNTWALEDKSLVKDSIESRVIMDKVYAKFVENGAKPFIWAYSQYEQSHQSSNNDMEFYSVNAFGFLNINVQFKERYRLDATNEKVPNRNEFEEKTKIHLDFSSDDFTWEIATPTLRANDLYEIAGDDEEEAQDLIDEIAPQAANARN